MLFSTVFRRWRFGRTWWISSSSGLLLSTGTTLLDLSFFPWRRWGWRRWSWPSSSSSWDFFILWSLSLLRLLFWVNTWRLRFLWIIIWLDSLFFRFLSWVHRGNFLIAFLWRGRRGWRRRWWRWRRRFWTISKLCLFMRRWSFSWFLSWSSFWSTFLWLAPPSLFFSFNFFLDFSLQSLSFHFLSPQHLLLLSHKLQNPVPLLPIPPLLDNPLLHFKHFPHLLRKPPQPNRSPIIDSKSNISWMANRKQS